MEALIKYYVLPPLTVAAAIPYIRLTCKQTIYTRAHVQTIVSDGHQASARAACVLQLVGTTGSVTARPYILLQRLCIVTLFPGPV